MRNHLTLAALLLCIQAQAQNEWRPTKNDITLAAAQLFAGAADGIREQVLYHPNELFKQHPGLNRQWWDSRISWKNKQSTWVVTSDANHLFRAAIQSADILSIGITLYDRQPGKIWKQAARKMLIAYIARKAGFHLLYSIHFKNH